MSQPAHGLAAVTEQVPATAMGSLSRRRDTRRGGGKFGLGQHRSPFGQHHRSNGQHRTPNGQHSRSCLVSERN